MTKKLMKTYIYEGFGFPIALHNVEAILIKGDYVPKIDVRALAENTIKELMLQETKLTGNQIKFIRIHFSKSLREFGKIVNESHTAVQKWENFKNKSTNMDPNIEIRIRLYIFDTMCVKNKNDKIKFYDHYQAVAELVSRQEITKKSLRVCV